MTTKGMAIRTAGDSTIAMVLAESMIALDNRRLRRELEEAMLTIDHLVDRIERDNARKLAFYQRGNRRGPGILRRIWGLLVVKDER